MALVVEELEDAQGYKVSGRGELHLSILIEKMRREGYEFQVTRPQVIFREEDGRRLEPYEELTIDVDEDYMGRVIENLGRQEGLLLEMHQNNGMAGSSTGSRPGASWAFVRNSSPRRAAWE